MLQRVIRVQQAQLLQPLGKQVAKTVRLAPTPQRLLQCAAIAQLALTAQGWGSVHALCVLLVPTLLLLVLLVPPSASHVQLAATTLATVLPHVPIVQLAFTAVCLVHLCAKCVGWAPTPQLLPPLL